MYWANIFLLVNSICWALGWKHCVFMLHTLPELLVMLDVCLKSKGLINPSSTCVCVKRQLLTKDAIISLAFLCPIPSKVPAVRTARPCCLQGWARGFPHVCYHFGLWCNSVLVIAAFCTENQGFFCGGLFLYLIVHSPVLLLRSRVVFPLMLNSKGV